MFNRDVALINLTPHPVNILDRGNEFICAIRAVLPTARVTVTRELVGYVNGMPVNSTVFGELQDLPEPKEGVAYIVSLVCAQAAKLNGRTEDLYVPDDVVRDADGHIIGCRALTQV